MEVPSTNKQDDSITNPHNGYYFYKLLCGVNYMNLHEKLNENTTLYYIESAQSEWDESTDTEKTLAYQLSFGFYDCTYMVLVTREDIETDEGGYLSVEGDSKLFDSFNEMVEGELWEQIKTKCKAFDKWYDELCA